MQILTTESASTVLLVEIRALLDGAFDGDFAEADWEHTLGGVHVLERDGAEVVGHAAVVARAFDVGPRSIRVGYIEGVATSARRRHEGFGSRTMSAVGDVVASRYELGALSTGAHGFYEQLGWERWRGPTYVRAKGCRTRTPDEDDGIMVLHRAAGSEVDLASPITCEERPGDDW
ncbi:aminoglycoside N-acetyltransferase AAC(2')-Ic [soil metagenome]